jgi:hypothetical protein
VSKGIEHVEDAPGSAVRLISADGFQMSGEIDATALEGSTALLLLLNGAVVGRIRPPALEGASVPFCIPVADAGTVQEGQTLSLARERDGKPEVLASLPVRSRVAGAIDRCNESLVRGWAANLNCPKQPLEVDIFLNGEHQGSALANRSRSDLGRMEKGLAATGFLFKFSRPLDIAAGKPLQVTARIHGTTIMLANSPWWVLRRYEALPLLDAAG